MANDTAVLDMLSSDTGGTISESQLADLGWTLKPEGLCQHDTCVLVPDRAALVGDAGIDLTVLGGLLDRPVAIDSDGGVAAIGAPRAARRRALDDLEAPDFTLPNVHGDGVTALSDHRSKKRLLIAFSSW